MLLFFLNIPKEILYDLRCKLNQPGNVNLLIYITMVVSLIVYCVKQGVTSEKISHSINGCVLVCTALSIKICINFSGMNRILINKESAVKLSDVNKRFLTFSNLVSDDFLPRIRMESTYVRRWTSRIFCLWWRVRNFQFFKKHSFDKKSLKRSWSLFAINS